MRNAVVLVSDAKIFPAAVFAANRLAALNDRDDTDIFIFTDSAAELRAAPTRGYPFKVVPIVPPGGVALRAMYFRMVVPVQMASRYARVLYMDVDMYAESAALFRLFDLDLRGHTIAAVRDYVVAFLPDQQELDAVFEGRHDRYFNSGLILVDCARYVARGALAGLWQYGTRPIEVLYADQSILNRYFDGDFLELSPAFNLFASERPTPLAKVCPPVITHFAGPDKPWMGGLFRREHPARAEMERYFPTSPWKGFLPSFFNLATIARPPQRAQTHSVAWGFEGAAPVARYLRETEFADVTAGITQLHLEALPATPTPA